MNALRGSARSSRLAWGVWSLGFTALVVASAGPAGATPLFSVVPLYGADRYETAAAIADSGFAYGRVVLLANGQSDEPGTPGNEEHFPDALAGAYLAGANTAPILLTTQSVLPAATEQELQDRDLDRVIIIGGAGAVSAEQEQHLRDAGYPVERVHGATRYATAAAVARSQGEAYVGKLAGRRTAIVASGVGFADALVMGPLSYASKFPITLTDPQRLSSETRSVLGELRIEHVLIPGGHEAVSEAVQGEIEARGITVRRLAGASRTETAAVTAEFALAELGFSQTTVDLALGRRFPDALAAAPLSGRNRTPLLLTADVDELGAAARGYLIAHSDTLDSSYAFGGPAAIAESVRQEAEDAGRHNSGG